MADAYVFDACTLWNFAVVKRLPALESFCGYRTVWTDAVHDELSRNVTSEPLLQDLLDADWLEVPISFSSSDLAAIARLRDILASAKDHPRMHLGEAESIFAVESRFPQGTFVTDDRAAAMLARQRGIRVVRSAELCGEMYSMHELACPEAWELLREMNAKGQNVYVPARHEQVCP